MASPVSFYSLSSAMRVHYLPLLVATSVLASSAVISASTVQKQIKVPGELPTRNRLLRKHDVDGEERARLIDDIMKLFKLDPNKLDDAAPKKMIEMVDMRKFDDVTESVEKLGVKKLDARKVGVNKVDDELVKFADDLGFLEKHIFPGWKDKRYTVEMVRESMKLDGANEQQIRIITALYKDFTGIPK